MNDNHRTPESSEPHDLDDLDGVDTAVAGQLRRTLQAVAAATPTEDRSAALLTAIDSVPAPAHGDADLPHDKEPAMDLDRTTDLRPPIWRRPAFLAAAAAVVVAAAGLAVVVAGDGDDPVRIDPADLPEPASSGWYLPPEGWEITEVRADFVDMEPGGCPCRSLIVAGDQEPPPAIVVFETTAATDDVADGVPIDIGGRPGQIDLDLPALRVGSGDHHLVVMGSSIGGVDADAIVALADAWLDQVEAGEDVDPDELPVPEGMAAGAVVDAPAQRSAHVVDVTAVEAATGRRVYYQLAPSGAVYTALAIDADAVHRQGSQFVVVTSFGDPRVVGLVGGDADIVVGPSFFGEEADDLPVEELAGFLAGLRQASLSEWQAATADAEVAGVVQGADSLFAPPLVDGPAGG